MTICAVGRSMRSQAATPREHPLLRLAHLFNTGAGVRIPSAQREPQGCPGQRRPTLHPVLKGTISNAAQQTAFPGAPALRPILNVA